MSETKSKSLREALAEFKQLDLHIPKSESGYGYNYAPLDVILPIINPQLKRLGLDYQHRTDFTESGVLFLETTIFKVEDVNPVTRDEILARTPINNQVQLSKMNEFMVIGSAMTYYRRYHLVTMLGLTADEDTDAGGKTADAGRSIDSKAQNEKDYLPTFKHQLQLGKDKKVVEGIFKTYQKHMSEEQIKAIRDLIDKHYENK